MEYRMYNFNYGYLPEETIMNKILLIKMYNMLFKPINN